MHGIRSVHLSNAISDAVSADRLYRSGVRLLASGLVAPPGIPLVGTLEVRPPGASKPTLTLLAQIYARTLDLHRYADLRRYLAAVFEAQKLPATTWEDREANKELVKRL